VVGARQESCPSVACCPPVARPDAGAALAVRFLRRVPAARKARLSPARDAAVVLWRAQRSRTAAFFFSSNLAYHALVGAVAGACGKCGGGGRRGGRCGARVRCVKGWWGGQSECGGAC